MAFDSFSAKRIVPDGTPELVLKRETIWEKLIEGVLSHIRSLTTGHDHLFDIEFGHDLTEPTTRIGAANIFGIYCRRPPQL